MWGQKRDELPRIKRVRVGVSSMFPVHILEMLDDDIGHWTGKHGWSVFIIHIQRRSEYMLFVHP